MKIATALHVRILTSMASILVPISGAHAFLYCSEPTEPYCLDGSGYFDDRWAFDSCRNDVEQFVREAEDYVDCLEDEQSEVIDQANKAIERFNCRAEGGSYCY